MNDIDDLISRALHDRAGRAHVAPAGFESVRRRARLRRSRHAAFAVAPVLVAAAYASGAVRGQGADVVPAAGEADRLDVPPTTECAISPYTVPPTDGVSAGSTIPGDAASDGTVTTVEFIVDSDGNVVTVSPTSPEVTPAGTTTTLPVPDSSTNPETITTPSPTMANDDAATTTTISPLMSDPTVTALDTATTSLGTPDNPCESDSQRLAGELGCRIDGSQVDLAPGAEFAAECDEGLTAWCTVVGDPVMGASIECTSVTVPSTVPDVTSALNGISPTTSTFGG